MELTEIARIEKQLPAAPTPAHMLEIALTKGATMEQLEKLMDLQVRWEANEARKAYVKAMGEFKAKPPQILKDKSVAFSGTAYTHASLANIVDAVVQGLSLYGFSHRWDIQQNGSITVTCIITHELGHSERVSMSAPADDSGRKNAIQQIASTITYLERYTLMAVTGLAARDMIDDDGQSAGTAFITEKQAAELKGLIEETDSNVLAFLKAMGGAESVDQLPADVYNRALNALHKKKSQKGKANG